VDVSPVGFADEASSSAGVADGDTARDGPGMLDVDNNIKYSIQVWVNISPSCF